MASPIWKDIYCTLGNGDSYDYRVTTLGGEVIYAGRAHKKPGAATVTIRINDICADYLQNVIPTLSEDEFSALDLPVTFLVQIYIGSWSTIYSIQFINDWSYDYEYDVATMGLAFPINGRIAPNQWLTYTAYLTTEVSAVVYRTDGTSFTLSIPVGPSVDFNTDFNSDFARAVSAAASGTAVFRLAGYDDISHIVIGNATYYMAEGCRRYALYYANAYGGWDSLLIEGNHAETDTLTRHTRGVEYDNRNVSNRGRRNYANEISKRLTLHTSWMTDEQSSRMHHLLNATEVYLYDMVTDEMIPVILANTMTEYKTYKGNGGRLTSYAIEVEYANTRVRR